MTKIVEKMRVSNGGGTIVFPDVTVDLDAGEAVNRPIAAMFDVITRANEAGRDPATGAPKRALSPGGMADQAVRSGRRQPARGAGTKGQFLASFRHSRSRGKRKAKAGITADGFFSAWRAREKKRGVDYAPLEGKVEEAAMQELQKIVEKSIK